MPTCTDCRNFQREGNLFYGRCSARVLLKRLGFDTRIDNMIRPSPDGVLVLKRLDACSTYFNPKES